MKNEASSTVSNDSDKETTTLLGSSNAPDRSNLPLPTQPNNIFKLDNVGNDHFRDMKIWNRNRTNYCRSYSRKFVEVMNQLRCTSCENSSYSKRFDKDNPPMLARCGHYIHKKCWELDGSKNKCKACSVIVTEPLRDEVLADFFKAIDEKRYQCSDKCNQLHDLSNIVVFPSLSEDKLCCVWCATENEEFRGTKAVLPPPNAKAADRTVDKLLSLNRNTHVSGWALDACCLCRGELRNNSNTQIVHLPCNHIGHKVCPGHKSCVSDSEDENKVECLLCDNRSWNKSLLKHRKWLGKFHLKGYNQEIYSQCVVCGQSHPEDNLFVKTKKSEKCVWCAVEGFGMTTE